jgi:hypothetical protein
LFILYFSILLWYFSSFFFFFFFLFERNILLSLFVLFSIIRVF